IDSLEPAYTCLSAKNNFSAYGPGSNDSGWTSHLKAASDLYADLDSISDIPPTDSGFHISFDHFFDNLSARLCHAKPLPCNASNPSLCVTQAMADEVFRLGQYEYSYLYRDAGARTLEYCVGSYGIWVAELAQNLRDAMHATNPASTGNRASSGIRYRHNIAHDGSVSRLLSILQIEKMVWPGMGSEVVFELYKRKLDQQYYIRVLWGGQVLKSSNPTLGVLDMLRVEILFAYFDGLAGQRAEKIPRKVLVVVVSERGTPVWETIGGGFERYINLFFLRGFAGVKIRFMGGLWTVYGRFITTYVYKPGGAQRRSRYRNVFKNYCLYDLRKEEHFSENCLKESILSIVANRKVESHGQRPRPHRRLNTIFPDLTSIGVRPYLAPLLDITPLARIISMSSSFNMSPVGCLDLPNEIIGAIFSHLSIADLLNVSLACERFCTVAQPLIYHTINLSLKPIPKPEEADQNHLVNLLPRLRSLYLAPSPANLDLANNPLIETLSFDFEGFEDESDETKEPRDRPSELEFLSEYLWLPSLRTLKASCLYLLDPNGGRSFPKDRYRASPVTSITLEVGDGETIGALPELLQSIKALQSLTFSTECSWEGADMIKHGMSPRTIGQAISHHASTLVELIIACSDGASFPRSSLFGTLFPFTSLKRLGIPETFLASGKNKKFDSSLPRSLEYIQLQYPMGLNQGNDKERGLRVERLLHLVEEKALRLPSLNRFIWWDQQAGCWNGTTYGPAADIHKLNRIFRRNGVRFQYRNASNYEETPLAGHEDADGVEHQYLDGDLSDDEEFWVQGEEYDDGAWLDVHWEA
ncbi:MAG: hypothetical protein Q9226_007770, partial [Calogaya cf. arnoldii]